MRLEEGLKFAPFQPAQDFVTEPFGFHRAQAQLTVERLDAVAAEALCFIECDISIYEQLLRRLVAMTTYCEADAGADAAVMALNGYRPGDRLYELCRQAREVGDRRIATRQQYEFVAANPSDEVFSGHLSSQHRSDMLEHFVPCCMSECVIDIFEAVEVDMEQAQRPEVIICAGKRKLLIKVAPVRKTCQCVVQRIVFYDQPGVFKCLVLSLRSKFRLEEFVLKLHVFRNIPVRPNDTLCTGRGTIGHSVRADVTDTAKRPWRPRQPPAGHRRTWPVLR